MFWQLFTQLAKHNFTLCFKKGIVFVGHKNLNFNNNIKNYRNIGVSIYLISNSIKDSLPKNPFNLSPILTAPTPAGVPVKIKSPVFNVMNLET